MNQFCEMKGILRQFSVARTPQQNGVAERRNKTLIEAARTMLADSKLPTTFWAEAVNTACYVQNRVLVVKPHNKTPYELFHGKTPTLSFMRPFGCPVTILNTINHLGKFDGKADEGFFVGYSLNSKAFRVFNSRTRTVKENLHIRFSKSTPNVVGTKASDNACQARKKTELVKIYILLPLWTADLPFSQDLKSSHDDRSKPSSDDEKKVGEVPRKESECNDQEKEDNVNNTNTVNAAGAKEVNAVGGKTSIEISFDPNMPALEDYSIFDSSRDDEDDGAEADMNNLDTTIQVSPILTTRIHKDHHLKQVIRDLQSATQTINMSKNLKEHGFEEPKKVIHALKDPRWIEAMLEELLQFKIEAIMLFLAYVSFKDFMVYQMDVKSAFLYGKIEEEVYVCQPPGFEDPDFPDRVYKFEKARYGLHQAPRAWHKDEFYGRTYILLEITSAAEEGCTPIETQKPLLKDEDGEEVDVHMYRSMIGSLMYLTSSRPDIMFAVCACARYQVNPKVSHLHAVKRIFSAIKSAMEASACGQVLWIQNQLLDYGYNFMHTKIFIDNNRKAKKSVKLMMEKLFRMELELMLAKTINGEVQLHALVDGKKIIVTESTVRRDLHLKDAEGMVKNLDNVSGKFLMYPRFVQVFMEQQLDNMSIHKRIYITPSHTKKIFGNMRRVGKGFSGRVTPLFPTMVVQNQQELGEGLANLTDPHHTPTITQPSTSQPKKTQKPRKPKRKDTQVPQPSGSSEHVVDKVVHKELGDSLVRAATTASSLKAE
ncbi:retrovirus-related pol polyprotein from transposon TNT 1-94 [Tanacetum coccineum]